MWQQIIVYVIGVIVAIYIAYKVYLSITRRNDPCHGCNGCSLKEELNKKKAECRTKEDPKCGCGCS